MTKKTDLQERLARIQKRMRGAEEPVLSEHLRRENHALAEEMAGRIIPDWQGLKYVEDHITDNTKSKDIPELTLAGVIITQCIASLGLNPELVQAALTKGQAKAAGGTIAIHLENYYRDRKAQEEKK